MAQPTNTVDTYDMVGIREDLEDVIYDISPEETPFYSACQKVKVTNTLHEWLTKSLRAAAVNANIQGGDTTAEARTQATRLGNNTQIFKNAVSIAGTDGGLKKAGRGKEMAREVIYIAKEQKLDIEKALFANQARSSGSGVTPPYLAGVPAWLTTNTDFQSGSSGADPTGDGTNARTDDGVPTAFSQTKFDTVMQLIWDNGGKPDSVYLSSFQKKKSLTFTGNNGQTSTVDSAKGRVDNFMKIYETDWGMVKFVPSRHVRSRDVLIMQDDMWSVGVLRPTFNEELAKTGDSDKRQVITELTLICRNEKASGGVFDNTTS